VIVFFKKENRLNKKSESKILIEQQHSILLLYNTIRVLSSADE